VLEREFVTTILATLVGLTRSWGAVFVSLLGFSTTVQYLNLPSPNVAVGYARVNKFAD
jgi:hypothetical protein